MAKILVLGGTGAMGVYLKDILAERGDEVYVTSRSERKAEPDKGIRYLQGDAHDVEFVKRICAELRPDAIVDFMLYSTKEFEARRDTLLTLSNHYVFLSSYRVFAEEIPLRETSPRLLDVCHDKEYLRTDEYALAKARQENLLRDSLFFNWTIIRPGITYSRNRFQLGCLEANTLCFRSLMGLPIVMPQLMRGKETTLTWGRDVALMISRLILNEHAFSEDFNCTTSEHHKWDEVCKIYEKSIGANVRDCSVEEYVRVIGTRPQVMFDRLFDRVMDNSKVLQTTGLKQGDITPLGKGLSDELSNFRRNPSYRLPNMVINARIDRLLGSRIPLINIPKGMRMSYFENRYPTIGLGVRVVRRLKMFA